MPSLLGVFAHPDDESLCAGGLLARSAARGDRTAVVTATWADRTHRAAELAEALRHLGAGEPRLLGYADARVPDSAPGRPRLVDVPLAEAAGRLVEHLREFRPDVVVTHDHHGNLTGHADHVRTHAVAVRAAGEYGAEVLLATHPESALPMLREVVGVRRVVHTVPDEEVARLDVRPWLEAKVAAVLAHRHEVQRGALPGVVAALSPRDRERLLGTEWYLSPRGSRPTDALIWEGPSRRAGDGQATRGVSP